MSRFLLGCLALFALALMVGQAIADATNEENNLADNSGVLIIESYTASADVPNDNMQPLPGDPGVEVAPNNPSGEMSSQPVTVEEDVSIEQSGN